MKPIVEFDEERQVFIVIDDGSKHQEEVEELDKKVEIMELFEGKV